MRNSAVMRSNLKFLLLCNALLCNYRPGLLWIGAGVPLLLPMAGFLQAGPGVAGGAWGLLRR